MRHYEIIFMVHPDKSDQVESMLAKHKELFSKHDAVIHRLEDWGKKQLAYPINKLHKAHYVLINIEAPVALMDELDFALKFNDSIIRYMITKQKDAITSASVVMANKESKTETNAG